MDAEAFYVHARAACRHGARAASEWVQAAVAEGRDPRQGLETRRALGAVAVTSAALEQGADDFALAALLTGYGAAFDHAAREIALLLTAPAGEA